MINLGLARISRLLNLLAKQKGAPEYRPPWTAIHIAGTNGKGSVAAYISAILNLAGSNTTRTHDAQVNTSLNITSSWGAPENTRGSDIRNRINVGRFTSPHFIDSWDCIRINDEIVPYDAFERARGNVINLATQVEQEILRESPEISLERDQAQQNARLTEFELLTATALKCFSDPELGPCDLAVIECGLGGCLDATNALPDSAIKISVITRIGMDHLDILGGSLRSIVREKCGILRKNIPVVIDGDNDPEVLTMIQQEITQKFGKEQIKSGVHIARAEDLDKLIAVTTSMHDYGSTCGHSGQNSLNSLGLMPHQKSNMAIALKVCDLLRAQHNLEGATRDSLAMSPSLLENVLKHASKSYPGRLQWIEPGELTHATSTTHLPSLNATRILLDGAHNAQSAYVLRSCVDKAMQKTNVIPQAPPESIAAIYDDFADPLVSDNQSTTSTTLPSRTTPVTSTTTVDMTSPQSSSSEYQRPRKVIWVLAMSSGKDIFEILETLIQSSNDEIIFTTFGPMQGMPWVKPTSLASLLSSSEVLDLQYHIKATVPNIVEALDVAEGLIGKYSGQHVHEPGQEQQQPPLVVIAGSLYLVSDFLRFQRDGREAFIKYWQESTEQVSNAG